MALNVPFQIPRVPGSYFRFNNELAGPPSTVPHRVVAIGIRRSTGTVAQNVARQISTYDQARTYWGDGSQIAEMARVFLANSNQELWGIAVDEEALGVAATGQIAFGGAATASGTIPLLVAGRLIRVGIANGDTPATAVDKCVTKLSEVTGLPVSHADGGDNLTFACRWKGATGNAIKIGIDPAGDLPTGLTATVTPMASGATDPTILATLNSLGADTKYDTVIIGFSDTVNIGHLTTWLEARWSETVNLEGIGFCGDTGSFGNLTTLAGNLNSKFVSVIGPGASATPPWEWAAATAALDAEATQDRPNRPRLQMTMDPTIRPPEQADRFTAAQRNTLLANGISTAIASPSGRAMLEKLVTTETLNSSGLPDYSYSSVALMRTLHRLRYDVGVFRARFIDWTLSSDDSLSEQAKMMTPAKMKGFLGALYRRWMARGYVQNFAVFEAGVRAEVDENKTDLKIYLPVDTVHGLSSLAGEIAFK